MRLAVLGASFTNENLGVGALAAGSAAAILEAFPSASIAMLCYGRTPETNILQWRGKWVEVPTVHLRMRPDPARNLPLLLVRAILVRLMTTKWLRSRIVSANPVLAFVESCDVAVSIAGGDSFSDIYGFRVLVDVCLPQVLTLLMGRRLIQLPQTIGPFNTFIGRWLGSQVLRRSAAILSRDLESIEQMKRLPGGTALSARATFCWDVGFLVEPAPGWPVEVEGLDLSEQDGGSLIGVNVSGLLHEGGLLGGDEFRCREAYRELSQRLIPFLIDEHGSRVVLIPHVHGEHVSKDTWICRRLYEEASGRWPGRVGFARGQYSTAEIKPLLGRCDLVVAGRMHACIGALSMGTPAVGVAYSRKFKGVFESLGLGEWVIDPRTMGVEEMLDVLGQCMAKRTEVVARLADVMPKVKKEIVEKIAAAVLGEGDRGK